MKLYKRCTPVLTLIALLLCLCLPAAAGEEDAAITLSVPELSAQCGQTVDVPIRVDENTGIAALKIALTFDDSVLALEYTESAKECCTAGTVGISFNVWDALETHDSGTSTITLGFVGVGNISETGTLVTIRFRVKDNIDPKSSDLTLSIDPAQITRADENGIFRKATFALQDGSVTVHALAVSSGTDTVYDTLPAGNFTVSANAKAGATMILAAYDADGRMLSSQIETAAGGLHTFAQTSNPGGAIQTVKVFTLGADNIPLLREQTASAAG